LASGGLKGWPEEGACNFTDGAVGGLSGNVDLFRERLDNIINPRHSLVRPAGTVPWDRFDEAFGGFFKPVGRKAKPTRLMVRLHYLKHIHDLSDEDDEEVVKWWVENPYWRAPRSRRVRASVTVSMMGVEASRSLVCRGWLQTSPCCCVQKACW